MWVLGGDALPPQELLSATLGRLKSGVYIVFYFSIFEPLLFWCISDCFTLLFIPTLIVLVDMSLNPSSRISIEWSVQQIESLCDNRAFKDDDKSFRRQFAMQRAISGDTKVLYRRLCNFLCIYFFRFSQHYVFLDPRGS